MQDAWAGLLAEQDCAANKRSQQAKLERGGIAQRTTRCHVQLGGHHSLCSHENCMSFMRKPVVGHSHLAKNELGLTVRDY
ncbi:MAG: hypothetical protein KGL00_01410, partial [Gammaproteobacteria bacterium]|nr:hypothetical protein [Gammaproteobacteria bacterium]